MKIVPLRAAGNVTHSTDDDQWLMAGVQELHRSMESLALVLLQNGNERCRRTGR